MIIFVFSLFKWNFVGSCTVSSYLWSLAYLRSYGYFKLSACAVYMVGAFVGWTIVIQYGLNFWLAALIGGLSGGLIGLVIERVFLRHLYKQFNEQVLLTFGFDYILVNLAIWVWGARSRAPFTTALLSDSVKYHGIILSKSSNCYYLNWRYCGYRFVVVAK